jgi:hypothetical protein
MENMLLTYDEITSFLLKDIKFQYDSYNHKLAKEEFMKSLDFNNPINYGYEHTINCFCIPDEYKEKYKVLRIGTLREVKLFKSKIISFRVGQRFPKTFHLEDFGRTIKPILKPSEDQYDLISRGLAVCKYDL